MEMVDDRTLNEDALCPVHHRHQSLCPYQYQHSVESSIEIWETEP